jgi:hypothetical protein
MPPLLATSTTSSTATLGAAALTCTTDILKDLGRLYMIQRKTSETAGITANLFVGCNYQVERFMTFGHSLDFKQPRLIPPPSEAGRPRGQRIPNRSSCVHLQSDNDSSILEIDHAQLDQVPAPLGSISDWGASVGLLLVLHQCSTNCWMSRMRARRQVRRFVGSR